MHFETRIKIKKSDNFTFSIKPGANPPFTLNDVICLSA